MTKLSKKVLSILCVIALLVSCIAMAFAEEADEAPVWDETAEQQGADDEAARIAAEEAEAARIAAEQAAAQKAAEEEAARKAAEEAARKAAEEEAARKAAEEEAARKAAEEEAARKAAEEEAARKAAEEEAARKAAEEEAARKAAEEEAARKAAEEEAARKAAEEEAARKAAEEEAARKAAEEEEARKAAEEEQAPETAEEVETPKAAEGESSDSNAVLEDKVDENGYYEIDDSWGYVDPDVISENTPEITDELKGLRSASMNVNEILSDSISFGEELVITLKCGSAQTVDLKLYTNGAVNVKVDDKAVAFTPADSDDPAFAMSTYVLENTAGRTHRISLTANDTVSFKLAAVAEQTEVLDMTPGTQDVVPTEVNNEEPTSSEDNIKANTENTENIEKTETNDIITENGENTEAAENNENADTTETGENIANNETTETTENSNEGTVETIQSAESPQPTIQVSLKTYSALKVGNSISDTLVGGQKAKIPVRCGKHNDVKLVLNSNPDDLNIQFDGADVGFTQEADGTYSIELNDVAFRKFTIHLAAKQDLAFTLSAEDIGEAVVAESEEEKDEEENKEDIKEENEENIDKEEAEFADESTEENPEENNDKNTEELIGETEENENTEEEIVGDTEASEEEMHKETEEESEEEAEEAEPLTDEQLIEWGYRKVQILNKDGADIYVGIDAEVIGHADFESELWIKDAEAEGWAEIYTEKDPEAKGEISKFIKLSEIEKQPLTEEEIEALGYRKIQILNQNGIDIYDSTGEKSLVIGHADQNSELWIKESGDEDWAVIYSDAENIQFIKLSEIDKQKPSDDEMLAMGYFKAFIATDIGAKVYDSLEESAEAVGHLDTGTELWALLVDDNNRAMIFSEDEFEIRYVNLVDLITTLKPDNIEDLPTRSIRIKSSLEGYDVVYYGTIETFTVEMINFAPDDQYTVQWKCSEDGGNTYFDIENAEFLRYDYVIDEITENFKWKVIITLKSVTQASTEQEGAMQFSETQEETLLNTVE